MEFDFNNDKLLGEGGYGEVKKCKSNIDQIRYIIKYIKYNLSDIGS